MKIYLASPFFNDNEIANIHRAAEILKAKGHEVFVPMEHDVENRESLTNAEWAEEIFKIDKGLELRLRLPEIRIFLCWTNR